MPSNIHFVGGIKVMVADDPEVVAQRLRDEGIQNFEQSGEATEDLWINAANVLYVEPVWTRKAAPS